MRIEELQFPTRIYHALMRARIETVEQLQSMTDEELLTVRGISTGSLMEIREKAPKPCTRLELVQKMDYKEMAQFMVNADWCNECDQIRVDGTCMAMEMGGPLNPYCVASCEAWLRQLIQEGKANG